MKKHTSAVVILAMSAVFMGAYGEHSQPGDSAPKEEVTTDEEQHEFKDLDDRFSYAYGADMAEKFKAQGIELNPAILAAAMNDVYGGRERKMSTGEIAATLELYFELHKKKKEAARAVAGKQNKKEGKKFLAENAKKERVVVTKSGLQYKVITEGNGEYKPTENDRVTVHYRARLIDGTEFDSTYQRNEAYTAKVKRLIDGWSEALQMMTEGSKWELYIPADLAYGDRGSEPYVGPNAVLIFEVELLDIEKEQ